MMNLRLTLILLVVVMGTGTSMGMEALMDFVIAGSVAVLAAPLIAPWLKH